MKRIIRLTESDLTLIVKKALYESNILLKEQWVRGKDSIGYWKILYDQLKNAGIGVKYGANGEQVTDPTKASFMYWGGWVINYSLSANGGYPVSFTDYETNVSMTFKFQGGKYAGQPADNIILEPKSINATFNLGQFGKLKNETVAAAISKYKITNPYNNSVILIYNEIVDSVLGVGTDPNSILASIKKLKTQDEFKYLLTLFKDKKTGYSSFFDMINQEYDRMNAEDVKKLIIELHRINVFTDAEFLENGFGMSLFNGGYWLGEYLDKTPDYTETMKVCNANYTKALPSAIKWWKDWLSDPITKQKVYKNYQARDVRETDSIDRAFNEYFELLNNIKLNYYNRSAVTMNGVDVMHWAAAFVTKADGNIYVNCSSDTSTKPDSIDQTLVHEIQHMIYDIKPLNPEKNIGSSFNNKNCEYESREIIKSSTELFNMNKTDTKNYSSDIISAAKKLGIDPKHLSSLEEGKKRRSRPADPGYFCRETENMSRIMAVRRLFNLKPGQNITISMMKPYITGEKYSVQVEFILYCWIENGYPDFNQMLNDINQLASNQNGSSNQNVA